MQKRRAAALYATTETVITTYPPKNNCLHCFIIKKDLITTEPWHKHIWLESRFTVFKCLFISEPKQLLNESVFL